MIRQSVLRFSVPGLALALPGIHSLLRANQEVQAALVLETLSEGALTLAGCLEEVRREARFLAAVDTAQAIGLSRSKFGLTPRQALIYAALFGPLGDVPHGWYSPVEESTLIAWGVSHYGGPREDLLVALPALVSQGLFFEVHPGVFAERCYYCTCDPDFLRELPHGGGMISRGEWLVFTAFHDRQSHGWRSAGLCCIKGRQGEHRPEGLCLGTSCCSFDYYAQERCSLGLRFNPGLRAHAGRAVDAEDNEPGV